MASAKAFLIMCIILETQMNGGSKKLNKNRFH